MPRCARPRARRGAARPTTFKEFPMHTNPPIVLIHGLWLTSRSWEGWKARFEERGHEVLTPAWPRMAGGGEERARRKERRARPPPPPPPPRGGGGFEEIRRDPSVMNGLGVTEVVD